MLRQKATEPGWLQHSMSYGLSLNAVMIGVSQQISQSVFALSACAFASGHRLFFPNGFDDHFEEGVTY